MLNFTEFFDDHFRTLWIVQNVETFALLELFYNVLRSNQFLHYAFFFLLELQELFELQQSVQKLCKNVKRQKK